MLKSSGLAWCVLLIACSGSSSPGRPDAAATADAAVAVTDSRPLDSNAVADASTGSDLGPDAGAADAATPDARLPPDAPPAGCTKATFTHHVTDVSSLFSVSPLPALAAGAGFEVRSYMTLKSDQTGKRVPVYAPTKMTLFGAKNYIPMGAPVDYVPDWALEFTADCEPTLQVGFAHIKDVVDKIKAVSTAPLDGNSAWQPVSTRVTFEAGELFGWYIKGNNSIAWDFIVQDRTVENMFVNMDRYRMAQSKLLHAVCPFDRFTDALRSMYFGLLAGPGMTPSGMVSCGTVAHDKSGAASGIWYFDANPATGTTGVMPRGLYGSPFSTFKGADGTVYVANLASSSLRIDPANPTHKDPATVTGTHCYQVQPTPSTKDGYAMLQVVSPTELRVAYSPTGTCPTAFPATYQTYHR